MSERKISTLFNNIRIIYTILSIILLVSLFLPWQTMTSSEIITYKPTTYSGAYIFIFGGWIGLICILGSIISSFMRNVRNTKISGGVGLLFISINMIILIGGMIYYAGENPNVYPDYDYYPEIGFYIGLVIWILLLSIIIILYSGKDNSFYINNELIPKQIKKIEAPKGKKFCSNCGQEIKKEATFCEFCGEKQ